MNINEVREYAESFGYKIISEEYLRSNLKLDMKCNKGHDCSISWDNFKYGRRCRKCADELKRSKFKLNIDEVKSYIEKYNCVLLSNEYLNNSSELELKCSCGELFEVSFANFKRNKNKSCKKCIQRKTRKHSYEYVKTYIESFGYHLISDTYIDAEHNLEVKCQKGHPSYNVRFGNFQQNKRCPYCQDNVKPTIEDVKSYCLKLGYTCLDNEYKNSKSKLNLVCDKGHDIQIPFSEFKAGTRCKICGMSKGEIKIKQYLKDNNIDYIYDKPCFDDLLSPKGNRLKPDFILPNEKIWFEYDGEFHYRKMYYNDNFETLKIHDEIKNKYAKKHGWKMIRIPYWDYDRMENILKTTFNMK